MDSSEDINDFIPSLINPRALKKDAADLSLTQNSIISRCSLSLRKNTVAFRSQLKKLLPKNKENVDRNNDTANTPTKPVPPKFIEPNIDKETLSFSAINDIDNESRKITSSPLSFSEFSPAPVPPNGKTIPQQDLSDLAHKKESIDSAILEIDDDISTSTVSSKTKIKKEFCDLESSDSESEYKDCVSVTFGLTNCENVDLSTKYSNIKEISITRVKNDITVSCDIVEGSQTSTLDTILDENMNEQPITPKKRHAVAVNLDIKKKKSTKEDCTKNVTEDNKVLFLKTNAIEKISHVIVQPPNFDFVKKYSTKDYNKFKKQYKRSSNSFNQNKDGFAPSRKSSDELKQKTLDCFFKLNRVKQDSGSLNDSLYGCAEINRKGDCVCPNDDAKDMSKLAATSDAKHERKRSSLSAPKKENDSSPKSGKTLSARLFTDAAKKQDIRVSHSDAPNSAKSRSKNGSLASHSPTLTHSPRKNADSMQFTLPSKSKSARTSSSVKTIPYYKVVAGTHFAVDAFSYGDIPNVKHYFLTHFHSDHYTGLKKTFNKVLYCSKITADLCVSRLGVNPKVIRTLNIDECIKVDGVEVTAVDANHCPGAIMLVFSLLNGKTILHTGDFRASHIMETYPIFWNKDIHTIYLDTTYCNPRYDFPTQDQSLEMALNLLRQKKMDLEKSGKKFSSVLIVCGTYTIGKEKFFLGVARRVGCNVWACPEKDRVLRAVEGRSFCRTPPGSCQLHVVPMRDLTIEKLHSYLESLQGAFSEVVAFKPSGWENGKNSTVERDQVTIHGIPYSEHSSFSELIRFVKFLKPRQVVPTVDIAGGVKAVQKYFPCPLVYKEDIQNQSKVTDFFSIQSRQEVSALVLPKSYWIKRP